MKQAGMELDRCNFFLPRLGCWLSYKSFPKFNRTQLCWKHYNFANEEIMFIQILCQFLMMNLKWLLYKQTWRKHSQNEQLQM